MKYLGISCGFHDAAVSLVSETGEILFAGHCERYSKVKHDSTIHTKLLNDAFIYMPWHDDYEVHYYERPYVKALRQLRAGQKLGPFSYKKIFGNENYSKLETKTGFVKTHEHHMCHAAAGFQTSDFDNATCIVIDGIGELDCISIWDASYNSEGKAIYTKLYSKVYPNSIGLMYSAMTQRVGLQPLDEEYILMGMAGYGTPKYQFAIEANVLYDRSTLNFSRNLHTGVDHDFLGADADIYDIAASTQVFLERLIEIVLRKAVGLKPKSKNLVYGGGVALNCLANRLLGKYYSNIWIMPNPGDAGNSLGAAALGYGKKLIWENAYLGHNMPGSYPVQAALDILTTKKIVGIANGKAEFGPRALGNRSLLADPRGPDIKDKVNEIKRRQQFRPFAPVILEELCTDYFDMPNNWNNSRYMQTVATCRYPNLFPAIIHVDGTSRVQTVPKDGSGIRRLLEQWYEMTGCPMLLNTSLNIRGEPMVNDINDARRFEKKYDVKVLT